MNELLSNIKEIEEGGKKLANWYLAHGYVLLDIQAGARADWNPRSAANAQMCYVRRNPVYVVGRPEGVPPAPRMPLEVKKEGGDARGKGKILAVYGPNGMLLSQTVVNVEGENFLTQFGMPLQFVTAIALASPIENKGEVKDGDGEGSK